MSEIYDYEGKGRPTDNERIRRNKKQALENESSIKKLTRIVSANYDANYNAYTRLQSSFDGHTRLVYILLGVSFVLHFVTIGALILKIWS